MIIALAASSLFAAPAASEPRVTGSSAIGVFLGQPTGISFRQGLGKGQSFEAKAAWNLAPSKGGFEATFQANWLGEFPGILTIEKADFPLYVGAGLQTDLGESASLGFRIPLGLLYRFVKVPLELCLELGLGMQVFPATTFIGSGGLGIRFRF